MPIGLEGLVRSSKGKHHFERKEEVTINLVPNFFLLPCISISQLWLNAPSETCHELPSC